jgi:glycosyltransferase involved in cell wall biosynthesis
MWSSQIKPLHLSIADNDNAGAILRLINSLRQVDIHASMLAYELHTDQSFVSPIFAPAYKPSQWISYLVMEYSRRRFAQMQHLHESSFSANLLWHPIRGEIERMDSNIIHLHGIGKGLVPIHTLTKLKKPIVWTQHDMWGFTGGCHATDGCTRYQQQCGQCPILNSQKEHDLSRRVFSAKQKLWKHLNFTVVTPSNWLADCVRNSSLFHDKVVEVIPNPVDTHMYRPLNKAYSRQALNLLPDKKLIVFSAEHLNDRNNGLVYLEAALQKSSLDNIELIIIGEGETNELSLSIPIHTIGTIQKENELLFPLLYSAADVIVVPSKQETFGQIAAEGLSCGTPVVAFRTSGLLDVVDHQQNGYLAEPYSVDDLMNGIQWVLGHPEPLELSTKAREKAVRTFAMEVVAAQYIKLYMRVLELSAR